MLSQHSDQSDESAGEIGNPLQIRLIDFFAVMTLGALVLAMVAPFVRQIRSEDRLSLMGIFCGQAIIITIVMLRAAKKRKKLLNVSGRRLGVGYCGDLNWRHWPLVKSLLTMLLIAVAEVWFAVALSINLKATLMSPGILFQQFQLGLFFGIGCSRYLWRLFPNSMEFYENGISLHGTSLLPWKQITVRDSKFFPDRIVVVIRVAPGSIEADTQVVQVTDRLRHQITTIPKPSVQ